MSTKLPVVSNDSAHLPPVTSRSEFDAQLNELREREKELTRKSDAVAAARRRLPMVPVDPTLPLIGPAGPVTLLDAFEGRRQLIAYYHMWRTAQSAAEQCEGCTWNNSQVAERSYLHSRDITYAVLCQGPYDESSRYREFMGWDMPWYSAQPSLDTLLSGGRIGMMHIVCYVRGGTDGREVYETYWTTRRGGGSPGLQLLADGSDRVGTPGGLGRLTPGLAEELGRRRHAHPHRRTAHLPVVPDRRRPLRRPDDRSRYPRPGRRAVARSDPAEQPTPELRPRL